MEARGGGSVGERGYQEGEGEGRRRQTLDPIIPPQPLVKTPSRKLVKKPVCGLEGPPPLLEGAGPSESALPVVVLCPVSSFGLFFFFCMLLFSNKR